MYVPNPIDYAVKFENSFVEALLNVDINSKKICVVFSNRNVLMHFNSHLKYLIDLKD